MEERDEATARTIGDWLKAQGIKGWSVRIPRPGENIEIELDWDSRGSEARIVQQFGAAVSITVLPEPPPE